MNILITGRLSSIAISLARTFSKEKHRIIVVAEFVELKGKKLGAGIPPLHRSK